MELKNFTFLEISHQTMTLSPYLKESHILLEHWESKLSHFEDDRQVTKLMALS